MVDFAAHTARIIHRLGQPVTLTPAGGPARVVNAVFSSQPDVSLMVSGYSPSLRLTAADGAGLAQGAAVAIGAKGFTVAAIEDDDGDSGDILLRLQAA